MLLYHRVRDGTSIELLVFNPKIVVQQLKVNRGRYAMIITHIEISIT